MGPSRAATSRSPRRPTSGCQRENRTTVGRQWHTCILRLYQPEGIPTVSTPTVCGIRCGPIGHATKGGLAHPMKSLFTHRSIKLLSIALVICVTVFVTSWQDEFEKPSKAPGRTNGRVLPAPPIPDTDAEILHSAEQLLIRDCMSRQGFRYWPEPYDPAADLKRFPYVVDDAAWAKAHGFGRDIHRRLDRMARDNRNGLYYQTLSEQQKARARAAIHGEGLKPGLEAKVPAGGMLRHSDKGCTVEAWRLLYGDIRVWYRAERVTSSLEGVRISQVQQDARFQAKVGSWRECMKARSYSVNNPGELHAKMLSYQGLDAATKDRLAAAEEVECARKSGLSRMAHDLDSMYATALRREYKPDFETFERLKLAALPIARKVISQG